MSNYLYVIIKKKFQWKILIFILYLIKILIITHSLMQAFFNVLILNLLIWVIFA